MQQAFTAHHVESPDYMGIHYMDATTVEECWRLLRQTGKSNSYESLANVPRYTEWLKGQDWTDAYARHKQNLQLVGLNDPEKRWILKNPSHMTALDALMTVYPDALVVYTHRDPVTCIASSCSLSAETTVGHSETYVGGVIGHTQLDLWSRSFHAFWDARPTYDQAQFADVAFKDLRDDPIGVTRGIYEQFGLDWTPEVQAAIEEIDRESRSGARGAEALLLARGLRADRAAGAGSLRPVTDRQASASQPRSLTNVCAPFSSSTVAAMSAMVTAASAARQASSAAYITRATLQGRRQALADAGNGPFWRISVHRNAGSVALDGQDHVEDGDLARPASSACSRRCGPRSSAPARLARAAGGAWPGRCARPRGTPRAAGPAPVRRRG